MIVTTPRTFAPGTEEFGLRRPQLPALEVALNDGPRLLLVDVCSWRSQRLGRAWVFSHSRGDTPLREQLVEAWVVRHSRVHIGGDGAVFLQGKQEVVDPASQRQNGDRDTPLRALPEGGGATS